MMSESFPTGVDIRLVVGEAIPLWFETKVVVEDMMDGVPMGTCGWPFIAAGAVWARSRVA